jgi:2-methylcitrate dehydratase PrpD
MAIASSRGDITGTRDFAATFAEFSANACVDSLPTEVVSAAKTNLFDTLACAIAGVSAQGVRELAQLVIDWGGKPEAAIWCLGKRVPAHHAAWVNGMMSHARDYDDTHDMAVLHTGVSVVPGAIAAAERNPNATGADLLAGIVVGLELICRLGVATRVGIVESGFIYSSLFGHFAATAAAARVMRLDRDQTVNALGIAYSQAAGTHQVTRDAALTKRIQPGFAAKTALISTAMTMVGIRGAQNVFQGTDGLFRTYLRDRYDPDSLTRDLGERFEFANLSYKPYPCCRFNHTAIDAAFDIRRRLKGNVAGIRKIIARVNRQAYEAVCTPIEMRKDPQTIVQAQFSVPYTVACALVKGAVTLHSFTEEGLRDPTVRALASKVESCIDEQIEREWSRNISPTQLVVETDSGTIEARIDLPRGSPKAPMSRADFDDKMADCVKISGLRWPVDTVQRMREGVNALENARYAHEILLPIIQTHSQ